MKKTYSKPEIAFESFVMSTNIAGDCAAPFVNNATKGSCGVIISAGMTIFVDQSTGCGVAASEGQFNGFCYHPPTDYNSLFNS